MPLKATRLEVSEASLADLASRAAAGGAGLQAWRAAGHPLLVLTRFAGLPWVSALLVAPRDHVWCDFPAGTAASLHVPQFPTCGPLQAAWIARLASDRSQRSSFKRALDAAGVGGLPRGLLGFDGGILHGAVPIGVASRLPPLWAGWFRAFMLPSADRAVAGLQDTANALLTERGDFALRAFADAAVFQQPAAEPYSLSDARPEALLLSQIYADPHPLGKPAEVGARIANAGKEALANTEADSILRLADCSALLGPATGLNLPIADHGYSKVMDLPRRLQDEIVSVRLEVVRRLGWPVFARQMINARQQVLARGAGRRPFGPMPFDPMAVIDAYLKRVREAHPMSLLWPLDHLWAEGGSPQ